ncbi:MAG: hypothetical protein K9J83_07955, partial [Desulfarculaceae bacterium]|nr:hypothetical protein [Desulfarculaceae bacterium]
KEVATKPLSFNDKNWTTPYEIQNNMAKNHNILMHFPDTGLCFLHLSGSGSAGEPAGRLPEFGQHQRAETQRHRL